MKRRLRGVRRDCPRDPDCLRDLRVRRCRQLQGQPVFSTITAAKNDAWVPWEAVAPSSFAAYANVMNRLADDIEETL